MPAYVIADTEVTDLERYEQYNAASPAAIVAGGGRFLVCDGELVVLEGDWQPSRLWCSSLQTLRPRGVGMSRRTTRRRRNSVRAQRTCVWWPGKVSIRLQDQRQPFPRSRSAPAQRKLQSLTAWVRAAVN